MFFKFKKNYLGKLNTYLFILFALLIIAGIFKSLQATSQTNTNLEEFIMSKIRSCYSLGNKKSCYEKLAHDLLNRSNLGNIQQELEKHATDLEFSQCHSLGHFLGRFAYQKENNLGNILAQCNEACHSGCFHGALEGYFLEKKLYTQDNFDQVLMQEVPKICGNSEEYSVPRRYIDCVHGIGHGLLFIYEGDLPHALKICDLSFPLLNDRNICISGALMENSTSSTSDHPSRFISQDDFAYPCTILDQKYQDVCFRYQSVYSYTQTGSFDTNINFCNSIPKQYQNSCLIGLGATIADDLKGQSRKEICYKIDNLDRRDTCIQGVVEQLGNKYLGNASVMEEFCQTVDSKDQASCYKWIGLTIKAWSKDENSLLAICNNLQNKDFINSCITGTKMGQ